MGHGRLFFLELVNLKLSQKLKLKLKLKSEIISHVLCSFDTPQPHDSYTTKSKMSLKWTYFLGF